MSKPRDFVVFGKTGQLARALFNLSKSTTDHFHFLDRNDFDFLASEDDLREALGSLPACDGMIIAAAYTQVDKAESDRDAAMKVNAHTPRLIAHECKRRNVPLVFVSTDYVFQGIADAPYTVNTPTHPVNFYGKTKEHGERAVLGAFDRVAVIRTSWVFDGSGKNFMTTMLRLAEDRESLNVVNDQIGRPSYAGYLAKACVESLLGYVERPDLRSDVYHVSGNGPEISWAEFAEAIFKAANTATTRHTSVHGIPSSDYPTPAKRPAYSVLDNSHFEATFNTSIPNWETGLKQAIAEWEQSRKSSA